MNRQLFRWLIAWVTLAEGLAGVLTVGFWQPFWCVKIAYWRLSSASRRTS